MEKRKFGNTDLEVSVLGFGGGQIGDFAVPEDRVEQVLNTALDNGINLIDTARGYYASEDRIGRMISESRRDEFILSTKVGYDIPDTSDWSYDAVKLGVEAALKTLRTDYLDIVHLHSCPLDVLERGEVIEALLKTVEEGKVRIPAYSGENEALKYAVECGAFKGIQTSVNFADQIDIGDTLTAAKEKGIGVIAKRSIANAPWRFTEQPEGSYAEAYWIRMQKMGLDYGDNWLDTALRFTAFTDGVSTSIVGTTNPGHLKKNIGIVGKGALSTDEYNAIREAFKQNEDNWTGQT